MSRALSDEIAQIGVSPLPGLAEPPGLEQELLEVSVMHTI